MVHYDKQDVYLLVNSFTPSQVPDMNQEILSNNISHHLSAGLHNIINGDNAYLEQAIYADQLTDESIQLLKQLSLELWDDASKKLLTQALIYSNNDKENKDAHHEFVLGIYQNDK